MCVTPCFSSVSPLVFRRTTLPLVKMINPLVVKNGEKRAQNLNFVAIG
jgi:hypothetical protein